MSSPALAGPACPTCGRGHDVRKCVGHIEVCNTCGDRVQQCTCPEPKPPSHPEPCRRFPRRGARVCDSHGGRARQVASRAAQNVAIEEARKLLGQPIDANPIEALLEQVHLAAGNEIYLREAVQNLVLRPRPVDVEGALVITKLTPAELEERVKDYEETGAPAGARGLVAKGPQGGTQAHVLVQLWNEERERLARFSALAIKAGIAEKLVNLKVQIAQQEAMVLHQAVDGALRDPALKLSEAQIRSALRLIGQNLRELRGGS